MTMSFAGTQGRDSGEWQIRWDTKIPMRDGIRLSATVYLPRPHPEATPAIFTLTPYIAQSYHAWAGHFAARGYPFLAVDARGRGNSEGTFVPFLHDGVDGYDIVEWIAAQPFCNGRVAMWGGSYAGFNQWNTAREAPPHLVTIVPVASPCMAVDFPLRNNIASPYLMQWLMLVAGRTSQQTLFADQSFWNRQFAHWYESGRAFKEFDAQFGDSSPHFQEWLSHPHAGVHWDRYNPTSAHYAQICLPILTITGIYDGDQPGALRHYHEHHKYGSPRASAQHFLVIGPWDHAGTRTPQDIVGGLKFGPRSLVDLQQLHFEWYRWTMRDGPKPSFLAKHVAYYVTGSDRWRYVDSLEESTSHYEVLHLSSSGNPTDVLRSGALTDAAPPGDAVPGQYVYDPREATDRALEYSKEPNVLTTQRDIYASVGKLLVYHGAPLAESLEVTGFFKLTAWFAIDQPDTDFSARVYEITASGESVLLTWDTLRARHRESQQVEKLVVTTEPMRYEFHRFTFVSRRLEQGSRLRLVIGPITWYSQRNFNAGGIVSEESIAAARSVTVKLFHDALRPSALRVPIGRRETADEKQPASSWFLANPHVAD